jgi:hypothetical protein
MAAVLFFVFGVSAVIQSEEMIKRRLKSSFSGLGSSLLIGVQQKKYLK